MKTPTTHRTAAPSTFVIQLTEAQASDLRDVSAICLCSPEEFILRAAMYDTFAFFEGNSEIQDDISVRQDEIDRYVSGRLSPRIEARSANPHAWNEREDFVKSYAERMRKRLASVA